MSQEDVLDFLKSNPGEWFSSKDMSEKMDPTNSSIVDNLKILRRWNLVIFKSVRGKYNKLAYSYKHKEA